MNVRRLMACSAIACALGAMALSRPKTAAAALSSCSVCIAGSTCDLFEDHVACEDACGLPADACTPDAPECGGPGTRLVDCKAIE